MTMLADIVDVVIGVDTHKHTHSAAVIAAGTGAHRDSLTVNTDLDGYQALIDFADQHSTLRAWAIEGTGSYGAGLTRFLTERGELVIELDRPSRTKSRTAAKSDEIDAVRAGREALAREHLAEPRARGDRAALAVLLSTRRSAVEGSADAQRQLKAFVVAAPQCLRSKLRDKTMIEMIAILHRLRINPNWDTETTTYASVMRTLARRIIALRSEATAHEQAILAIVKKWRPDLLEQPGVGPIVAATVLCAWSHPGRCRSEAAFASLAGVAPIPASSGQTTRYRLNRCRDRQLNQALYVVTLSRLRHDPTTQAYAERRRSEGKTNPEIRRCLKRYIARQLYRQLEHPSLSDAP